MKPLFLLTFLMAWLGHAAIWLVIINVVYSRPLHKNVLKLLRAIDGGIVFAFPFVLAILAGPELTPVFDRRSGPEWLPVQVYVAFCLAMACCGIPWATLSRVLRPRPPQLVDQSGKIVKVAAELGEYPVGNGKYKWMARLPGNQVFDVEINESVLNLANLPAAWDGLSILHLTDLHLTGTPDCRYYECAIAKCLEKGKPDVLVITGDLLDTDTGHELLTDLLAKLSWNDAAFAILGNHDIWHDPEHIRAIMGDRGITVVSNSWTATTIRGETMIVVGHEGPWLPAPPDLSGCPEGVFRLLLSHTPDHITWARRNGFDLMLSGHNHGGQIRLPVFGPLFVPSRYSRRYASGFFWEPPTLLHVCRGLGQREPLRYNCRPEISRLVLKKGTHAASPCHGIF